MAYEYGFIYSRSEIIKHYRNEYLDSGKMIIECQNNNVPACKFYKKQGALLSKVDMYAYYHEKDCKNKVQFVWYLDLNI